MLGKGQERVAGHNELIADRYRLLERIAVGGMSTVWIARDERLHRQVALKLLQPTAAANESDPHLAELRTMREARITARLHHPHAVPVYDVVDHEGAPCLVMQYVVSRSLQALITQFGALDVQTVARIGSEIAGALTAAHEVGIVHRDVKPGNVLIASDGSALITDFGISHALGDVSLTSTGMVTGTPAFLAPEVARGDPSGFASDVFSLGATLYAALEGTPPFGAGENPMAVLHRVASGRVLAPRRSGRLTPLLTEMLELDPRRRPAMRDVAAALARVHALVADPAAAAPTARISPAPVALPSATVSLPPVRAPLGPPAVANRGRPSRSRRATPIAVAVVVTLLLAGLAVLLLTGRSGSNNPGLPKAGGGSGTAGRSVATTPSATRRNRSPSRSAPARSSAGTDRATTSGAASSTATGPAASSTATRSTGGRVDTSGTALVNAIVNYYALLPDNTDAAWPRLTAAYQRYPGGGRAAYNSYWSGFSSVSTRDVVSTGASSVVATITYFRKGGSTSAERTSFGLVREDGILKINSSMVLGAG